MRKILLSMVAMMAIMMCASCSQGLENKAKKQMKKTMRELAKNPDTFKTEDIKTILNNDSVVVLEFRAYGQNGFGGFNTSKMQYCYVKHTEKDGNTKYYECVTNLDNIKDDAPHAVTIKELMKECKAGKDENFVKYCNERKLSKEDGANEMAYMFAYINCQMCGREIEEY